MTFSDEQSLFAVVILLYVTDCFLWTEKHSFSFICILGKNWKLAFPSAFFANKRGGVLFINPLFPLSSKIFQCHLFPVSISPIGICAYNSQAPYAIERPQQTGVSVEYKDIISVDQIKNDIYINKALFVKCNTVYHAELIINILHTIIPLSEHERGIVIKKQLQRLFDFSEAIAIIGNYTKNSFMLRVLCFLWFALLIIIYPIIAWKYSLIKVIILIIVLSILITAQISIEFYNLHKLYYPMEKQDRINTLLKMILCPPTAINANDKLTLKLISFYDPLCLGFIFFSKNYFAELVQKLVLDLKYPIKVELIDNIAIKINIWHRKNFIEIYKIFLEETFSDELRFIPNRLDNQDKSYCPRCLCQFNLENGECPDCIGIKLVRFNSIL